MINLKTYDSHGKFKETLSIDNWSALKIYLVSELMILGIVTAFVGIGFFWAYMVM